MKVSLGDIARGEVFVSEMMIGRWSEDSDVRVCQSVVGRRLGDARVMSGEVKGPPGGALVGKFSLRTPKLEPMMAS